MTNIPSPKQRRSRNREEMKAAILSLARDMMRRDGPGGLNLNEIARKLKIKTPSLYGYFDGKMGVYDALFQMGMEIFGARFKALSEQYAGWDLLRAAIENYMTFAQENPELFQIMFERPIPGFVPSDESMALSLRTLDDSRQQMAQFFEQVGIDTGLPTEQAGDLIIAMLHGLASQHLANEPHLPIGEGRYGGLVEAAVNLFRKAWQPES